MRVQEARQTESAPPRPQLDRRTLIEEVLIVLSLSLLASAVFAIFDLLSAPLHGIAVATAAILRGSYHLYQGWGGFTGNMLLGLFFGALFVRWRRAWPLVIAHFLVDVAAGVGYIVFKHHLPGV